jgi:hypothetical protein
MGRKSKVDGRASDEAALEHSGALTRDANAPSDDGLFFSTAASAMRLSV